MKLVYCDTSVICTVYFIGFLSSNKQSSTSTYMIFCHSSIHRSQLALRTGLVWSCLEQVFRKHHPWAKETSDFEVKWYCKWSSDPVVGAVVLLFPGWSLFQPSFHGLVSCHAFIVLFCIHCI